MGESAAKLRRLKSELHRVIVGQDYLIDRLLIALICDGHILLEGVPGLAKTKSLSALTACISGSMARIQFTPDLLPSDLVGTEIFRPNQGEFVIRKGPIFTNLLLADEINRAPAKVQSALLQAMQEREITIGENTFSLPKPFLVLATQNPIEQEGTYPLPEAQLDRFLMKVKVSYPSFDDELRILKVNREARLKPIELESVLSLEELVQMQRQAASLYVDPEAESYIVTLVQATRHIENYGMQRMIEWGASPRATLALRDAAQSLALLRGATSVITDDVKTIALDVLRHRVVLSFEAQAQGLDADQILQNLIRFLTI